MKRSASVTESNINVIEMYIQKKRISGRAELNPWKGYDLCCSSGAVAVLLHQTPSKRAPNVSFSAACVPLWRVWPCFFG